MAFTLSKGIWMECPQDHFISDALGGQGAGKDDRVIEMDAPHSILRIYTLRSFSIKVNHHLF